MPADQQISVLKYISYSKRTNTFGLDSIGVFPVVTPYDGVRSLSLSGDAKVLISGHSDGSLKLFAYPSTRPSAAYKEYLGHSQEGISRVCFSMDDQFVLTLGRDDRTIMQWKFLSSNFYKHPPKSFKFENLSESFNEGETLASFCSSNIKFHRSVGVNVATSSPEAWYCGMDSKVVISGSVAVLVDSAANQSIFGSDTSGRLLLLILRMSRHTVTYLYFRKAIHQRVPQYRR